MKVKIKSFNGELPSYLMVGKEYKLVKPIDRHGIGIIVTDDGYWCHVQVLSQSERLNGGSWEVVE